MYLGFKFMSYFHLLYWLLAAHVLFDFPLQGDFLSKGKSRSNPLPGVPWAGCLTAHAFMHGAAVAFLTHSYFLGFFEFFFHWFIDFFELSKPRKKELSYEYSNPKFWFGFDQSLHILCKVMWAGIAWVVLMMGRL